MALMDWFNTVWQNSGLVPLWNALPDWLALDARQLIFVVATPLFIGLFLWEYRKIRHNKQLVDGRESWLNFMLGAGYQTTELLFAGLIAFPLYAFAYQHRLLDVDLNVFTAIALWFWWIFATTASTAPPPGALVLGRPCNPPLLRADEFLHCHASERHQYFQRWLAVLCAAGVSGFNPVWIGVSYALSLVYQYLIHTTLVGKLHPAIEYVFNTPSHHRVHHGRNPEYIDQNYAGVLLSGTACLAPLWKKKTISRWNTASPARCTAIA